jgi:tetratricopeptide (TPR) repeat protein
VSIGLFAQIQNGIVREINSDKKPLNNVYIKFDGSVPEASDDKGSFRLAFSGKEAGELIFMEEITKKGFEIVNIKEIEELPLSNTDRLATDIILAKSGVIAAAKKEYYDVSDAALLASFEREKKRLRNKIQQNEISQKQYQAEKTQLQEQYDIQKSTLDAMAEKFARVNFDDVDNLYKETLILFKVGKIDECILKLENADLIGRTTKSMDKIQNHEAEIAKMKADLKKSIPSIQLLAQNYALRFEIEKAAKQYDQLLLLDSTDLDILREAGEFYQTNHKYQKAIAVHNKVAKHSKAEPYQIANAYGHIGELNMNIGLLEVALTAYKEFLNQYKTLSEKYPNESFYKENLAISYSKLGSTHTALGNLNKALTFFEQYNQLEKELYDSYPTNVNFKNVLAISYSKLGSTHTALGNLNKALTFFEQFNQLEKELYDSYPTNVNFKNGLAISYEKLGETHTALGNLNKVLTFFETETELFKELYDSYPTNVNFKNGLAISYQYLGNTHTALGNLNKALTFFEQFNQLEKELYDSYPTNVNFKNGLAISYSKLGSTHTALGNLNKALTFFEKRSQLGKELYDSYPTNVNFKNGLAISYIELAQIALMQENYPKAKDYLKQAEKHFAELHVISPENSQFKQYLDTAHEILSLLKEAGF